MTSCKAILSLAVLLLAAVPQAVGQGTYTQIDYPGAAGTSCIGINTAGDISGTYSDGVRDYGFLLKAGAYTSIDYPGASAVYVYGLNDTDQIVGFVVSNTPFGFVYDATTQTYTEIAYPGAVYTYPYAINNAGTVVGDVTISQGDDQGFELIGSTYSLIDPPGSSGTYVADVSATGELVGQSFLRSGYGNFSFTGGKYGKITIPNAPNAEVCGIDSKRHALTGSYISSSNERIGFLYQHKTLTTLQFPGAFITYACGINDSGEVVGSFYYETGNGHGFTWTPPADAGKK